MQVTVLGSGTAIPVPDRFPAGYLVEHGSRRILIDLGPGVLRRAAQAGLDLRRLDAVLFTHFHTDHCADFAALLFALRSPDYAGFERLDVLGAPSAGGTPGLRSVYENLCGAWPWLGRLPFELRLEELAGGGARELADLQVEPFRIEHTAQSLAWRLTDPAGKVATFSGDAVGCDGLVNAARDADLFVCDAAFPAAAPGEGHMTPAQAGRIATRAGARRLLLTHFYPRCDGHDLGAEAAATFAGPVDLARDLLRLRVGG